MTTFVIEGGYPIEGTIRPTGNKNAALPLLAACLLTDEPVILHNLPRIGDVQTMLELLAGLGVEIELEGDTVTLCARNVHSSEPDVILFSQIRGSLTLMGRAPISRATRLARTMRCAGHSLTAQYRIFP